MKFFWEGIIDFDSSFSPPASFTLLITESIELFIVDQAFSYDLTHRPPPPPPVSNFTLFLSLPVCRP
jgi:hypothetical protein